MIKNFIKKFSLKTAEREIEDYSRKVAMGNSEQHGMILGHALLIFAQFVKKLPVAKKAIESKEDVYGKELADLVLQTNSLLKEYASCGDRENAAGVKLLNETFRCLAHPELTQYGTEIWSYFSKAQKNAEKYLDNLEDRFIEQGNNNMVTKIREAKEYLFIIPDRYCQW
jgi:hypothetical protein